MTGTSGADGPASDSTDADILPEPSPTHAPVDVVRIQVEALRENDHPHTDAGIETAWRFASPANRANTGPFDSFRRMVRTDDYAPMVDHGTATMGPVGVTGSRATVEVALTGPEGRNRTYRFRLSRSHRGHRDDCWLTDAVLRV
jgi:hypothetical protein